MGGKGEKMRVVTDKGEVGSESDVKRKWKTVRETEKDDSQCRVGRWSILENEPEQHERQPRIHHLEQLEGHDRYIPVVP